MRIMVWMSAWQLQCCGEDFAVGDVVNWTLSEHPDYDWLCQAIGEELGRAITHSEDHHEVHPGQTLKDFRGRVVSILSAHCGYVPSDHDRKMLVPLAGSSRLQSVDRADGWEKDIEGLRFNGYVVEVEDLDR